MRIILAFLVVLFCWLAAEAVTRADDLAASETGAVGEARDAPLAMSGDEVIVLCGGFDVSPGYDWTGSIAGRTVGLRGWGNATELVVGDFRAWLPWPAPIVAGAMGTSLFLLFVGTAIALRPGGVRGSEAS